MRFNASEHPEPQDNFSPLPKGRYQVRIAKAQECENTNRNGFYLKVELDVIGPSYQGRKLWSQMTTAHEVSTQAVEIGLGQVSAMARSIGIPSWNHESEIVGAVGEVYVGFEKDDPTRNRVTGWVVPSADRGAPTYTAQHQAHAASQHNIDQRGGQLRDTVARASNPPPPRPTNQPAFDDDLPF